MMTALQSQVLRARVAPDAVSNVGSATEQNAVDISSRPAPSFRTGTRPRVHSAVVVHAGARDAYQLALGLEEAGLLRALVTDFFWSPEGNWGKFVRRFLSAGMQKKLMVRSIRGLRIDSIVSRVWSGAGGLLLDKAAIIPFGIRRWLTRRSDATLGRVAGQLARRDGTYLVSYSYYGFDGFKALGRGDVLFQMHPHPASMRRLFREEIERHPESAASLNLEWELALPEDDFRHLVEETRMARAFLVASSFTRETLIEHGADPSSIRVIPYGVDLKRFYPKVKSASDLKSPLRLLFVGRINQRKGLRYLLEALETLTPGSVELTICGHVLGSFDGLIGRSFPIVIRPSVSGEDLVSAYQEADLFVLPSIAEGFGQVLLEALASGLPILATTRTAAPDLIEDGVQGFVVKPQRSDLLAERILWSIQHRQVLKAMGALARIQAETFTWQRFRTGVAGAVADFMAADATQREEY